MRSSIATVVAAEVTKLDHTMEKTYAVCWYLTDNNFSQLSFEEQLVVYSLASDESNRHEVENIKRQWDEWNDRRDLELIAVLGYDPLSFS